MPSMANFSRTNLQVHFTHVSKWLLSCSYTSTLLHCLAKCMALFWCLDKMLQSAPLSIMSRTISEFPLLQAWVGREKMEGQKTMTNPSEQSIHDSKQNCRSELKSKISYNLEL